jgi:hypothetical protein
MVDDDDDAFSAGCIYMTHLLYSREYVLQDVLTGCWLFDFYGSYRKPKIVVICYTFVSANRSGACFFFLRPGGTMMDKVDLVFYFARVHVLILLHADACAYNI